MIPVIYYAHSIKIYGSEREQQEQTALETFFPNGVIYNPNRPYIDRAKEPMKACFEVVADSIVTGVAFSTNDFFYISLGVYAEVRCAQKRNKEIYRIYPDKIEMYPGGFTPAKKSKDYKWMKCNAGNYS